VYLNDFKFCAKPTHLISVFFTMKVSFELKEPFMVDLRKL